MYNRYFVVGANGQLGNAFRNIFLGATFVDRAEFDMTDESAYQKIDWNNYDVIINAAAMTNVDGAETPEGRELAWNINARAVSLLARVANEHGLTLVHVSSDYVFDGTKTPHEEDELFSPMSVYGASKAAGDIATALATKHYIVRSSWVVGKGNNFVKTMYQLAQKGVTPKVVNDQIGRLTFTEDLAGGIKHLIESSAPFGTYNLTNSGDLVSWADIAKEVYVSAGRSADDVTGISTAEYYAGKDGIAPRPLGSELNLAKITGTGFIPRDWRIVFSKYIEELKQEEHS